MRKGKRENCKLFDVFGLYHKRLGMVARYNYRVMGRIQIPSQYVTSYRG